MRRVRETVIHFSSVQGSGERHQQPSPECFCVTVELFVVSIDTRGCARSAVPPSASLARSSKGFPLEIAGSVGASRSSPQPHPCNAIMHAVHAIKLALALERARLTPVWAGTASPIWGAAGLPASERRAPVFGTVSSLATPLPSLLSSGHQAPCEMRVVPSPSVSLPSLSVSLPVSNSPLTHTTHLTLSASPQVCPSGC